MTSINRARVFDHDGLENAIIHVCLEHVKHEVCKEAIFVPKIVAFKATIEDLANPPSQEKYWKSVKVMDIIINIKNRCKTLRAQ